MTSVDILTSRVGIEFAPVSTTITRIWDGTCLQEGADINLHETCTGPAGCVSGWEGVLCDTDIDDCASFPCEDHLQCFDVGTNAYECRCVGGWGFMCTQPQSASRIQEVMHTPYCWVATDAICSSTSEDYTFTDEVTSLQVCQNYCTLGDWCTHIVRRSAVVSFMSRMR